MKNKFLLLSLICLGFISVTKVNAQIQHGNVMMGADLANISIGLNTGSVYSVAINPKAAWFVRDNLAIGGYVNLGIMGAKNLPTTTNYGIGVLGRYFISDPSVNLLNQTRFFFEANVGIEGQNISQGGPTTNGLGLGFGPGISYFVTPSIGLEGLVKYNGIFGFGSTPTSSNLNFGIGFQIYLPGKGIKETLKMK